MIPIGLKPGVAFHAVLSIDTARKRVSHGKVQSPKNGPRRLERLKKYCGHLARGFLGFGEASAKEQVQSNPVTEPKRSQNPKGPLPSSIQPDGYSISLNALTLHKDNIAVDKMHFYINMMIN